MPNLPEITYVQQVFTEGLKITEVTVMDMNKTMQGFPIGQTRLQTLKELKCHAIEQALIATGGKKMEAARLLDVNYSSFKRMLEKYGR